MYMLMGCKEAWCLEPSVLKLPCLEGVIAGSVAHLPQLLPREAALLGVATTVMHCIRQLALLQLSLVDLLINGA